LNKIETQAAKLGHYFERLMIHIVEMQQKSGGDLVDLSKQEANVVYCLGQRGRSIMRELADNLRLHVSTMTGIVDKLAEKGFVTRERCDDDRRIVRVSLTEKGELAFNQENEKRQNLSLTILHSLNDDEREEFLKLFSKVAAQIEKTVSQ
jgi:DNA-binding MarR family transcriptional regulator